MESDSPQRRQQLEDQHGGFEYDSDFDENPLHAFAFAVPNDPLAGALVGPSAGRVDRRDRKTARKNPPVSYAIVADGLDEDAKNIKLQEMADVQCGGQPWYGKNDSGKGFKQRTEKGTTVAQVRVRMCGYVKRSACGYRIREIHDVRSGLWSIERATNLQHSDHGIDRSHVPSPPSPPSPRHQQSPAPSSHPYPRPLTIRRTGCRSSWR